MAKRYTNEFRRDAVRMATTSGLTRPQLSSDLFPTFFDILGRITGRVRPEPDRVYRRQLSSYSAARVTVFRLS